MIRVPLNACGTSPIDTGVVRLLAQELGFGSVRLVDVDPGRKVGRQSALPNEMAFVVLDGAGRLDTEDGGIPVHARQAVFAHAAWWRFACAPAKHSRLLILVSSGGHWSRAPHCPLLSGFRDGWIITHEQLGAQRLCVGIRTWRAHAGPGLHRHATAPQTTLVLDGDGWVSGDRDPVRVTAGDLVHIGRAEQHGFSAGAHGARLLVAYLGVGDPFSAGTDGWCSAPMPLWRDARSHVSVDV